MCLPKEASDMSVTILGSGRHDLDPSKVEAVSRLERPVTKKQVRQQLGLFG